MPTQYLSINDDRCESLDVMVANGWELDAENAQWVKPADGFVGLLDAQAAWESEMAPHDIADVEPLAKLHHEMDQKKARYAALWALYGPGGVWEHDRKALLASLSQTARQALLASGLKFTEAMIDESARASEKYMECLATAKQERTEFETLDLELDQIRHRIRRGDSIQYLASRASRLPQPT